MNRSYRLAAVTLVALAGTVALAQPGKDTKPAVPAKPAAPAALKPAAAQPDAAMPQLPPGWTEEDMQACMVAGTPGAMHEHLAQSVGTWHGKSKMWMAPGTEPMDSECTAVITSVMDGRYTKCDLSGEIPGMGAFTGCGITGFDNVTGKFQGTWIDNHSTQIMFGTGELSSDGKTMNFSYNYNCPVTKKTTVMREVQRQTGKDTMTFEMFTTEPKSGKEYKMMEIAYTRKGGATANVPSSSN